MATYRSIATTETDPQAPITASLMKALDSNATAIGEADPTVPLNLLPTVNLGTTTITSAASGTASGLVLTPYKFLAVDFSLTPSTSSSISIAGTTFSTGNVGGIASQGLIFISLATGRYAAIFGGNAVGALGGTTSITTATTSIAMAVSAGTMTGTFRLLGMK